MSERRSSGGHHSSRSHHSSRRSRETPVDTESDDAGSPAASPPPPVMLDEDVDDDGSVDAAAPSQAVRVIHLEDEDGQEGLDVDERACHAFIDELEDDETQPIMIEIDCSGGDMFYVLMIANAIAEHEGPTTARIRRIAAGGTAVIALACDSIIMSPTACMSGLDSHWLPVKNALPALEKLKEAHPLLEIAHDVLTAQSDGLLTKLQDVLVELYTTEELEEIMTFFYENNEMGTPIFARDIMEGLPFLDLEITRGKRMRREASTAAISDGAVTSSGVVAAGVPAGVGMDQIISAALSAVRGGRSC